MGFATDHADERGSGESIKFAGNPCRSEWRAHWSRQNADQGQEFFLAPFVFIDMSLAKPCPPLR